MFSRGQACLKRRGLSVVLDNITTGPEEPLLFLYPHWFTSAFRKPRPLSSRSSGSTSSTGSRGSVPRASRPARGLSFGSSSRRLISGSTYAIRTTSDGSTNAISVGDEATISTTLDNGLSGEATRHEGNATTGPEPTRLKSSRSRTPRGDVTGVKQGKGHVINALADNEMEAGQQPVSPSVGGNDHVDRTHSKTLTVITGQSPIAKPLSGLKRLSVRDRRKVRYRRDHNTTSKMDHEDRIQSLLVRLQQDIHRSGKKGSKQKELLVPEETLALLAGITDMAMKENIWYVHVHNGCKVHVLHPLESEGQYRKVLLSGSERVMELVCDRISHVRNLQELGDPLVDIRKPVVPIFPSMEALRNKNISPPLIRGVWDHYRATRNPAKLSTIRSLSKDLSTVREFAEHVDELTRSQPSRDAVLGYKEMPHRKQVAEALIALFNDDANSRLFSTAALNRALSWMCDYEFLHCTGTVLLRAEHVATVDTFNILLRSAAKRQDMGFFYRSLLVMLRMKIRPNDFTWLAYLDSAVAPKTKTDRMAWLIENGYITQTDAVRTALQMTIQDTFLAHLESGRSVDSFINMTIDSHGTNWFSPSLISQMFSVTSRLKDFSAMDRLLQICQQQGLTLDSSAVNQILLLFQSDIFSAIRYLFRCSEHPETMLKTEAWERLFLIAFKGRHYNICRVLWRYACIHKGMTWNMKRSVLLSLTRNVTRKKKKDLDNIWRTSAGKVIVGVDLHLPHYLGKSSVLENVPPEFHHSAVSYLASGFKTEGEERQKQLHLAKLLIQRDIQVGPWYRPTQSFSIMLEAAALMDQEWKGVPRPMQWLMQNAIQVPVQASNYPQ